MAADQIRFGTDGWRAIIAKDYTFDNLGRVAHATVEWLKSDKVRPTIVLGHDARFMGAHFAEHAAAVMEQAGAKVLLADGITPTPAISWATQAYGADAGVVITASHNTAEYNGYKIKASFGGPATQAMTRAVEALLPTRAPSVEPGGAFQATRVDVRSDYARYLSEKIDLEAIRQSGVRLAHDAMYGAGQGFFTRLLGADKVVELHSEVNPSFGGLAPEPIGRNMGPFMAHVARGGVDIGIANDGDADRIGVLNEFGEEVTSHLVMALLVRHLHVGCGLRGSIVKTNASSAMLDKMGAAYGLPVETLPIGFKHVAPRILETDVLMGGEESGGIALMGHICERDGIYAGLVLLEMLVQRGKPLSALVQELFDEFGTHAYHRIDFRTARRDAALDLLRTSGGLEHIAGDAVQRVDTLDGFKHFTRDGWLLVRASGTEPVLRVYAEASTKERAVAYVEGTAVQLGIRE